MLIQHLGEHTIDVDRDLGVGRLPKELDQGTVRFLANLLENPVVLGGRLVKV
jgi:hypothetical protein